MQINKSKLIPVLEILVILILGLIPQIWFRNGVLINSVDTNLPFRLEPFIREYLYVWSNRTSPGFLDINKLPYLVPFGFILALWSYFRLSFSVIFYERLMVYYLFTGTGLGAYLLYQKLFKDSVSVGRITATLFYMFNFYVMYIFVPMPLNLISSYAFFPLVLSFFIGLLESPTIARTIIFSFAWYIFLNSAYTTPPYLLIHLGLFFLYFLFHITVKKKVNKIQLAKFFVLAVALWGLMNSYWLVPLVSNIRNELTAYVQDINPFDLFKTNSVYTYQSLRLMGYFGFGADFLGSRFYPWYDVFNIPLFKLITYSIPLIAFSGLLLKKKNKNYLFVCFIAILFIFLVKGPNPPLGSLNATIYKFFGLFTIFRTGYQRFTGTISLAYSLMIAYSLETFYRSFKFDTFKKWLSWTLIIGIIVVLPSYPFWTGQIYQTEGVLPSPRIVIPNTYFEAADWFNADGADFNIFPIPYNGVALATFWWNGGKNGYNGIYPMGGLTYKRFFTSDSQGNLPQEVVSRLLEHDPAVMRYLGLLNVKYLIFHKDSNWDFIKYHSWWLASDKKKDEEALSSANGLKLVKENDDLAIYQVDDRYVLGHFYVPQHNIISFEGPDKIASILENNKSEKPTAIFFRDQAQASSYLDKVPKDIPETIKVTSDKISPAKYQVHLEEASQIIPLVFSETYNNGWKAYVNGDGGKKYPLDEAHLPVNGYANSWVIDTGHLCKDKLHLCQKSPTGKFSLDIVVELKQQKLSDLGLRITAVSVAAVSMVLLYLITKKIFKRV